MDSKSLPLYAGLAVLIVAGVFLIGRNLIGPDTPGQTSSPVPRANAPQLHPQQAAAREAIRAGDLDGAIELLARVEESDPAYVMVLSDLGVLYERTEQPEAALQTARRVIELQPGNLDGHFVACRSYFALARYDFAEYACLRTLEVAPNHLRARFGLGTIRIALGKLDQAIDSYLRALDYSRDEQRIGETLDDLNRLVELRPEFPDPHYALAFFANTLGSRSEETAELSLYLELGATGPAAEQARVKLAELE